MTISDYIIIYLSAGAPFAVFAFLQRKGRSLARSFAHSIVAFLAWPGIAAVSVYRQFFYRSETPEQALDRKVRNVGDRLEEMIRQNSDAISIHDWREKFDRYVGLSRAIAAGDDQSEENELFAIAGNKNGKLGTVCLNRRNRSRLIFHHTVARNDFLDALVRAERGRDSLDLAVEIATLLDDADALADLATMLGRTEQISGKTPVIDMEQEVWNPPTPKQHIANRI
ncbi:MAG TPA: hypothetical protein VL327_14740 [Pyrinomonadaceae bacterium]|jgi:hypothetical protein|nr:hypothetical protein [Pyrinomonadaceae bacterium]